MTYLTLFWEFFKTGLLAVGGGLATLPFLYDMSGRMGWFSYGELMDMIAVSESTPGPIGVNMATYAGFSAGGVLGGLAATLALAAPSVIVILIVAKFLEKFRSSAVVEGVFYGLRPAVVGLIAAAGFEVLKVALLGGGELTSVSAVLSGVSLPALAMLAVMLPLRLKFEKPHPIIFIAAGALAGILLKL